MNEWMPLYKWYTESEWRITSTFGFGFSFLLHTPVPPWSPGCGWQLAEGHWRRDGVGLGGCSWQPGLYLYNPVLVSLVLCSHPDFAGVPRPAVPAVAVSAIAHSVPCEERWDGELWMERAAPSCLTFNKAPLFTPYSPDCCSVMRARHRLKHSLNLFWEAVVI